MDNEISAKDILDKIDNGFRESRESMDRHYDTLHEEHVESLNLVHERINGVVNNCTAKTNQFSGQIAQKADMSCMIPVKNKVATHDESIKRLWKIIIILLTSTGVIGGGVGIWNIVS